MIPLFAKFPTLQRRLPRTVLADLPTPVKPLAAVAQETGIERLYIKRDDLSSALYGGNKVRKLEFILADALAQGARTVLTFGCAGSNHALATAVHARRLQLHCINMLMPQPNAHYVRQNLLMSMTVGAELHYCADPTHVQEAAQAQCRRYQEEHGDEPYVIPFGGTMPLGDIGFVNAALELKEQIETGLLPEPDLLYVTFGSMGAAVGLLIGLKLAGLKTRLVPVRVTPEFIGSQIRALELFDETVQLLNRLDPSFPVLTAAGDDLLIRDDFFGTQYALFTEEAVQAAAFARDVQGLELDGTYTGKTFAALLQDARSGQLAGKTILYWHTLNGRDLRTAINGADYRQLPVELQRYFEDDVQPLDR